MITLKLIHIYTPLYMYLFRFNWKFVCVLLDITK